MTFKPGNSLATHSSQPGRPSLRPVAYSGSDGRLRLDFGDVRAGAQISFCDVLRATSSSSSPQHVAFTVTGASAAFVQRVTFGDLGPVDGLDPGQTRRVAATLVAPRQAVPGTYTGILSVSVLGTNERHELPMTVTIIGRKPHPDHTPVHPPIPASSPIPAPPSPSPSPSPSSSAGPSVSPVPSPSPSPVQIFSLKPGESTLLPSADGSVPPAVAQELPDGGLRLDFGAVPTRPAIEFPDVLRLGSVAVTMTEVSLELSGLPEGVVQVGASGTPSEACHLRITLTPGEEARIAFSFDFAGAPPRTGCSKAVSLWSSGRMRARRSGRRCP